MTVSLCKHSFPIQPPHGSIVRPGPCVGCGITWDDCQADLARQEAALIDGSSHDGQCGHCDQTRRLYRWQPLRQPWDEPDYEPPITWLCAAGYDAATQAYNADIAAAMASGLSTP
ncbi:hypothetical protein [Streptomyces sp. NBRC 109706]|uniref:hypothetical protein n=1 Tax=Streptomyces sp. NBRC 109706 TaxID=1550035 RepID=UPI000784596A|nr:hypothetical protein [Streptomyces sp. NBRC 109706]